MPPEATLPPGDVNVPRDYFSLAGFAVFMNGRFWVFTEDFRALETIPNLSIIRGSFLTNKVWMLKVGCPPDKDTSYVRVIKTEEKGSDVNLATHLLFDACRGNFECAAIVSKDSDLLEPIRIVREELGLSVGLLNPGKKKSFTLTPHADFIKEIRRGVLMASQFPDELQDANGTFRKPASW